jgi:hypothetical protein
MNGDPDPLEAPIKVIQVHLDPFEKMNRIRAAIERGAAEDVLGLI